MEEPQRAAIRCALFDLDGTLSLLRDGWQDQMVPLMADLLAVSYTHLTLPTILLV